MKLIVFAAVLTALLGFGATPAATLVPAPASGVSLDGDSGWG